MVVSNTGPLTSALQSDSLELIAALFGPIRTSKVCVDELVGQGWGEALTRHASQVVSHGLLESEAAAAAALAARIAAHPATKERDPSRHIGEAEVMILAQRPDFAGAIPLLDEQSARAIAVEVGMTISGFAGVLLMAAEEKLLTADQVRARLVCCQQQGTHYGKRFIERVFEAAKVAEGDG